MIAAEDRPITLRKRNDLQIQEIWFQQERSWVIKDPVGLRYHRLQEPEMLVLGALNGSTTLRDLRANLQQRFPHKLIRYSDLQHLLGTMHRAGLVVSDAMGQGGQLLRRRRERRLREWKGRLTNLLAIRFPGIDPDPILRRLLPWFRWLFRPVWMIFWLSIACSAMVLVLSQFDLFRSRLPGLNEFFGVQNLFWLGLVLCVTKVCHEFGHGLACRNYEGECHEIGAMLLVLTPALYCDTSDSWLLSNKWHRIMIGAGGMYFELIMASLATFFWWFTQPGLLNYLALNVMFICSVSTFIFNANPLLRYDGYYMLSDFLEIPNLSQKSRLALLNILRTTCLGMPSVGKRSLPTRNHRVFALYSVASFCYRWFVLFSILWFLTKVFEPYGLKVLGQIMVAISLGGLIGMPLWKTWAYFAAPGRWEEVKRVRLWLTCAGLVCLLAILFWLPLPRTVHCPCVLRPDGGKRVYVLQPGRLESAPVRYGEVVEAGQLIAILSDPHLTLDISRLRGEEANRKAVLTGLERRAVFDPLLQSSLPPARRAWESARRLRRQREQDLSDLTISAPATGTLFPPEEMSEFPSGDGAALPSWSIWPLDLENLGAWFETNTLLGVVAAPGRWRVTLVLEQELVDQVIPGQRVQVRFDALADQTYEGELAELASEPLQHLPRELGPLAKGPIVTRAEAGQQHTPMFVHFAAELPLDELPPGAVSGLRGRAKIHVPPESLAARIKRFLHGLMHFR